MNNIEPITITLAIPDRVVSQNAQRGESKWAAIKKSKIVKAHRSKAFQHTFIALRSNAVAKMRASSITWAGYSLAFFFPTMNFRDEGNAEGSCKAYIDGICDALGINDRHFNKMKLTTRAKDAANPRVEITIYPKE